MRLGGRSAGQQDRGARTFAIDWGLSYNTDADTITHCKGIAAAATQTNTDAAIALIGVSGSEINLG